ncbi:MAG: transglutaminase-like domain-containing protein [Spirochaetaceae bacterium]|nr:transglutaminase-like domain-containing protein [Spirochaetaceae bacterium]
MFKVQVMRYFLWLYILSAVYLWWQGVVTYPFFITAFSLSFFIAFLAPTKVSLLRSLLYLAGFGLLILASNLIVLAIDGLFFELPLLFIGFNLNFAPLLPIILSITLLTYLSRRFKAVLKYEFILRFAIILANFWPMANYNLTFFNPLTILITTAIYLLAEAVYFIWLNKDYSKNIKKSLLSLIILIPLLALLPYLFTLTSRQMSQNFGGLLQPTLDGRFDFTDELSLETSVNLGSELLLFLRTQPPISGRMLFKRFTLAGYNPERGFYRAAIGELEELLPYQIIIDVPNYNSRIPFEQEFYVINLSDTALLAANMPQQITPFQNWAGSNFRRIYAVNSLISTATAGQLGASRAYYPNHRDIYANWGDDEDILNLALAITAGLTNDYQRAVALHDYLKYNYYYSLNPGQSPDGNQLNYFLFEGFKGYCTYFAFAMALMARSIGLPARVASGFFAEEGGDILGFYPISSAVAHAWVEIYFEGYGWISFDPTSDQLAPDEVATFGDSYDITELFPLLNEIIGNRLQLTPLNEQVITINSADSYLPQLARASPASIIIIILAGYILIITLKRLSFLPRNQNFKVAGRQLMQLLALEKMILQRQNNIYDILNNNKPLADSYRKVLFSPSFNRQDYLAFKELWRQARAVKGLWRLWLWLTPQWFWYKKNDC